MRLIEAKISHVSIEEISINLKYKDFECVKLRRKSVGGKHVDDCEREGVDRSHDRLSPLKHRLLEIL